MSDQTKNLHQRMSAVMEDVQRLKKDKQVGSGNYAYQAMSEEKVATVLRNALITHGLVIFPVSQQHSMVDYQRGDKVISLSTVDVQYKIVNIDNPTEFEYLASSGTGVDPQDKGVGKAMTYAMKYVLMRTFLIPTGNDPDSVHNEDLERQQQEATDKAVAAQIQLVNAAATVDEVTAIWGANKGLQKNADFKVAVATAGKKLKSNA
jgi:hypothetical protein